MTDSRFSAANSFSLLTSSVSFVSLECISPPFLLSQPYQLPEAPPPPLLPPPPPLQPPPPQSLPERLPALSASIPSRNQSKPLPPDPPPRRPPLREDRLPIAANNRIKPSTSQTPQFALSARPSRFPPAGG